MQAKPSKALGRLGAFVIVLAGLLFLACPAAAASAFQGNWVGPWEETTLHQSGVFLIEIDGTGHVEGVVTNGETHGVVRGAIAADGELDAVYSYDGKTFYAAKGTFSRDGSHLRGTAHYFTSTNQPLGSSDLDLRLKTEKPGDSDVEKISDPVIRIKPKRACERYWDARDNRALFGAGHNDDLA